MKRLLFVLATTAVFLLIAVEGSAIAQGPKDKAGCPGIDTAIETQRLNPSENDSNSNLRVVGMEHDCKN